MSSIYEEDLLGDPTTIEEIVEVELDEADESDNEANASDPNPETEENAVPELQTAPEGVAVDPKKKRVVKNPQPKLNPVRLMGPRGIAVLEETFKDFQYHGKGFEKSDLNQLMKRLEHWAHRLFPKFTFDDCLQKIENLGHKKEVKTYVKRIRMGLVNEIEPAALVDDDNETEVMNEEPIDAFDALIGQQLSANHQSQNFGSGIVGDAEVPAPLRTQPTVMALTEEQKERMRRNRLVAEQRKLERLKALCMRESTEIQETSIMKDQTVSATNEMDMNNEKVNYATVPNENNVNDQNIRVASGTNANDMNHENVSFASAANENDVNNHNISVASGTNEIDMDHENVIFSSAANENKVNNHNMSVTSATNENDMDHENVIFDSAANENNVNNQNISVASAKDENYTGPQNVEIASAAAENYMDHQNITIASAADENHMDEQNISIANAVDKNGINSQDSDFDQAANGNVINRQHVNIPSVSNMHCQDSNITDANIKNQLNLDNSSVDHEEIDNRTLN